MQGFEVLRRMKQNPATKQIPVVGLSNLGQESDVQQALQGGAIAAGGAELAPDDIAPLGGTCQILAGLRIDERRAPQDGRFEADLGGFKIGLRVSSLPTHWGEKVVLRVLSKENVILDLEDLGLGVSDFDIVLRNILRPFGMVLITGPTGSGKTTSL